MNAQDKQEIAAIVEAVAHHHDKRAMLTRIAVAIGLMGVVYVVRILTGHEAVAEAFHLMLEGGVAVAMEKTIFGIG